MKKIYITFALLFAISTAPALAQFSIGASYELRNEEPKSGFGLRVERAILDKVPLVNFGIRLHGSYFSEENSVSENGFTYSEDLTNYDFGAALTAGISVGLMEPYVGLGLGSQTLDIKREDAPPTSDGDLSESNLYWNGFVGAKVPVVPLVKPFVEFRYSNNSLSEPEIAELSSGRIIFGVVLSF